MVEKNGALLAGRAVSVCAAGLDALDQCPCHFDGKAAVGPRIRCGTSFRGGQQASNAAGKKIPA